MRTAKAFLVVVGVVSIILAVIGLWYNSTALFTDFSGFEQEQNITHFYPAFYAMSAICIACYVVLLLCGIQFVRFRTGVFPMFASILIFEIVYFFSIDYMIPNIGMGIVVASGVANCGLLFQFFIQFTLWALLLAGWAARKISVRQDFC